ncbi:MAG: gingipain R [bacterium F082]|nr:MAG: gingipain R [bacterium F082]KWW30576.1 MAG: gingipain R [bacterium P201]
MLTVVTFGQQWVAIKSDAPSTIQTTLVASSENQITVNMQVPGFYTFEVTTPRGEANIISVPRTVSTAAAGEPNLPMIAVPAIIGDQQHYSIRLIDAQYTDFQMEVAPSKGDFPRTINPDDVPYTYGEVYSTDAFFPAQNVGLYDPYILRDFRGQNMVFYPFAYNPVTHTLRVYYNMTVEMYSDGQLGENTLSRRSSEVRMDPEFGALYQNHFINYSQGLSKYNAVDETGELLIICHDAFMDAMQPFVNWKKQIGRPVTMVGTSVSGSTSDAIKTYIQSQYNSNPNISHILLVGDNAQVQSYYTFSGGYSGRTDQYYGQLVGNDYYNDVIVGRFSAENADHVTTQVDKVIHYERDVTAADTWLSIGQGVSKNEGAGSGHFGEADYQHIDYIRDTLLHYNYTSIHRDYQNVQGVSSSAAIISQHINEGVSIINYCNHGSPTSWGVFNYSNSHINALTNDNKLPFIWSVACNNGQLDYSQPCFAEAWMRATNNSTGAPTGAIGGMFSYISQPWQPPMYGQDEMNNVLTEHRSIKRTLGGISTDGNMKILDQYNSNGQGLATYQFWLLFGDPTLTVRNMTPANMNVTHASSMSTSATSFTVNATNGNGALATLTRNNEIMGSATINNGTCNITFAAPGTTGTATLTVFGYNKITYIATIQITGGGTQQYTVNVSANPNIGGSVTGGGTYNQGQSCTVTATPNAGYTFTNWTENGNVVSTNRNYTFTVTANRTLVANFQAQPQNYNITVSANPSNGGSVAGGGTYQQGQSCTVTATANTGYAFANWTENGTVVSTQAQYSFTVTGNRTLVANFTQQQFTITAIAEPGDHAGSVEGGGTYTYGQSCTLTATPCTPPFIFVNWTKNGVIVSTNNTYTFTVTESATYIAHFVVETFTVSTIANPAEGGILTGGGTYEFGEIVTVNATPNEGFDFVNWTENGLVVSADPSYTFGVGGDHTLTANFALQTFEVKVSVNPSEAGTVTGEGTYNYGDEVTLTIVRNEDWAFENWTENGEVVSEEMNYTFIITSSRNLDANFIYTEGIGENSIETKVYPNPTKGEFTLEGEGLNHVRIVNAYGQMVYNADVEGDQVRIDLSQMAKGIYMMHIEAEGGQAVRKIVVE